MDALCKASTGSPETRLVKEASLSSFELKTVTSPSGFFPAEISVCACAEERETMWHGLSGITILSRHFNSWAQRHISDV